MSTFEKVCGYRCILCHKEYGLKEIQYTCRYCNGNLQVAYDYQNIKKHLSPRDFAESTDTSIWRYIKLLPVKEHSKRPSVHIGWTPLYKADPLGKKLGLKNLYIKDDGRNPSASSKDRAGAVAVVHALEQGSNVITCASTGNAASSLACLTAPLDMRTVLFVPATAPRAKIAQLLVFDAVVITIEGTYDQAYDLCLKGANEYGWYNRNTGYNPYTREGKKTVSYEICEQLGWKSPDKVFVPVGDGNLMSGVWKGFVDLYEIGFIQRKPQLIACQAEKSDAIKRAFESDGVIRPVSGRTIADSISVSLPRDGDAAVMAIRESKGYALSVQDSKILEAIPELAAETGVFAEPAGAAPYAALKKAIARNLVKDDERVVLLVTGSGLKDIESALKSTRKPFRIQPDIEELKGILAEGIL